MSYIFCSYKQKLIWKFITKGVFPMGNKNDNTQIRSRSEKRDIEAGGEPQKKEFKRGNGSQNNLEPEMK